MDPIDGTYDYINDLEEFTINAGLIINNKPIAGLINAPAKKRMFYSYGEGNAYELSNGKTINLSSKNIEKMLLKTQFLSSQPYFLKSPITLSIVKKPFDTSCFRSSC